MTITKMKNEKNNLYGRLLFELNFVDKQDLENKKVLDLGCGTGWFENSVKNTVKEIIGLDISKKAIEFSRKNIAGNTRWVLGSALNIPLKKREVDTIVSWDVLEHIDSRKEDIFFKESGRVLKKGGCLYFGTPNDTFFGKLLDPAYLFGHRHYKRDFLYNLISNCGFTVEKEAVKGKWFELIGSLVFYISKWIFKRGMMFENYFKTMQNKEFEEDGFAGIFFKLKKL